MAVTYDAQTAATQPTALSVRESALGTPVRQYRFGHANLVTHVLEVAASRASAVESALRAQPGVRAVGFTVARRHAAAGHLRVGP